MPRIRKARRRFRPCFIMASTSMKLPMNRKMIGLANGRNTLSADATPMRTHRVGPSSAVTAMGSASVIHSTITRPRMASRRSASGERPDTGAHPISAKTAGAASSPIRRRHRSKASSAADSTARGSADSVATGKVKRIGRRPVTRPARRIPRWTPQTLVGRGSGEPYARGLWRDEVPESPYPPPGADESLGASREALGPGTPRGPRHESTGAAEEVRDSQSSSLRSRGFFASFASPRLLPP